MLRPSPYCDAVSRCDDTKAIKPIRNKAYVAFSEDIAPRKHYNVCVCDRRHDKQALLYTAQNSHLNRQWQIL